jgi:ribosomal protein S18 acetylase RimI-like enzyme
MTSAPSLSIERLENEAEAQACARLMASSEPWITLGRTYETSLRMVQDPTREVYIARDKAGLAGFLILCMTGALVGYIQTICIQSDRRGQGLGSRLVQFAEDRILEESPNVFMCVSSFNHDARRLYERLGYCVVGELTNYIVEGYSEILIRKTRGPLAAFAPEKGAQRADRRAEVWRAVRGEDRIEE